MKYMLMLYADEKAGAEIVPEAMARVMESMHAYQQALTKAGAFVATAGLARTPEARTLRMEGGTMTVNDHPSAKPDRPYFEMRDGELRVHDGPYADTREQFGGYFIIEAEDMDAAVKWAARCPAVQWGSVEVRPFHSGNQ